MNAQQLKTWEAEVGYLQEKIQQQQAEIEELKHYIEGQNRKILDLSFALEYAKRTDEFVKDQEK